MSVRFFKADVTCAVSKQTFLTRRRNVFSVIVIHGQERNDAFSRPSDRESAYLEKDGTQQMVVPALVVCSQHSLWFQPGGRRDAPGAGRNRRVSHGPLFKSRGPARASLGL